MQEVRHQTRSRHGAKDFYRLETPANLGPPQYPADQIRRSNKYRRLFVDDGPLGLAAEGRIAIP